MGGDILNTVMLKAKIVLNGETQAKLAKALGIAQSTFTTKLHGKDGSQFTQSEIAAIKKRYDLTPDEVIQIFLN